MALRQTLRHRILARTGATHALACCLLAATGASLPADEFDEAFPNASLRLTEELDLPDPASDDRAPFLDPAAANFEKWEPIDDKPVSADCDEPPLRPFDWMRHWGFRHSSTDGRYVDKNVPLQYSSWLNRPYHVDWFLGPLMADNPVSGRVAQSNEVFGGLRVGWDFDYFWGVEWRFGWADPQLSTTETAGALGDYFVSDVDFLYYPWGDTRVRPYFQLGLGVTQLASIRDDGSSYDATLLGMPFGVGVQFQQTRWLAWRLEIIDNLAFAGDGLDTMNNIAFTAGMEVRLGARPNSYWPWRSSRTIW